MERLPVEILEIVYDYVILGLDFDVRWHYCKSMLGVNRRWRQTLLPLVWKEIDVRLVKNTEKYPSYLYQAQEYLVYAKSLVLLNWSVWNDKRLGLELIHNATSLQQLFISRMNISQLRLPNTLTRLVLYSMIFDDSICYEYPLLTELHLTNCRCLDDDMLLMLVSLNLQLKQLTVSGCSITKVSVKTIMNLELLEYLDISNTSIDVEDLSRITSALPLKTLVLQNMPFRMRQADLFTDALTQLRTLESLDVRGISCGLTSLLNMEHFGLKTLKFGTTAFLKDVSLRSLLINYPFLTTIEFGDDVPLSDMALFHLIQRARQLERLVLPRQSPSSQLHLITCGTLLRIPTSLPNLKYFEGVGYHMNSDILQEFYTHSRYLECLIISQSKKSFPFVDESAVDQLLREMCWLKKFGCKGMGLDPASLRRLQTKYWRTLLIY